jgi:hypothetical protein
MQRPFDISEGVVASEMAIVDTFTKLIFGQESHYSDAEVQIIEALSRVDVNVAAGGHSSIGVYLRALGVPEMIALVSRVRDAMSQICSANGIANVRGGNRAQAPRIDVRSAVLR